MAFEIEQVSAVERRIKFTIPSAEVNAALDNAFRDIAGKARLNGFRKGKVPRSVLEQRFGRGVRNDVASDLINRSFRAAVLGLEYFGTPKVQRGELTPGADFDFSITVEVKPELDLQVYKGVTVRYPRPALGEDRVEAELNRRLQGQASLAEISDRPVQAGDFVLAELRIADGDQVVHEHPGTMINTESDPYYTGLEAALIGLGAGEAATREVSFAEGAGLQELAGRTLSATITVQSIQAMQTPPLTDELAAQLGFEGGAEGMRADVRKRLEESVEAAAKNQARANLLQALIDANTFDAPKGLIDQQLNTLLEELRIQRAYRGEDPRKVQFTDAQMADFRNRARFAAKASLILDFVAAREGLAVSDEDLEAKYNEIAQARGQQVEAIRGYFEKENAVEELRARLLEEKVLDWLLGQSDLQPFDPAAPDHDDASAQAPQEG